MRQKLNHADKQAQSPQVANTDLANLSLSELQTRLGVNLATGLSHEQAQRHLSSTYNYHYQQ